MRRGIRRLEIVEAVHLEGIGLISSVLPNAMKHVEMKMFYDTNYPGMVIIKALGATHFLSTANVKSGTFDSDEVWDKI